MQLLSQSLVRTVTLGSKAAAIPYRAREMSRTVSSLATLRSKPAKIVTRAYTRTSTTVTAVKRAKLEESERE